MYVCMYVLLYAYMYVYVCMHGRYVCMQAGRRIGR